MAWIYHKENQDEIRTCDICSSSQIKTNRNTWAIYFTKERVMKCYENLFLEIEEKCFHTPDPDSE